MTEKYKKDIKTVPNPIGSVDSKEKESRIKQLFDMEKMLDNGSLQLLIISIIIWYFSR